MIKFTKIVGLKDAIKNNRVIESLPTEKLTSYLWILFFGNADAFRDFVISLPFTINNKLTFIIDPFDRFTINQEKIQKHLKTMQS